MLHSRDCNGVCGHTVNYSHARVSGTWFIRLNGYVRNAGKTKSLVAAVFRVSRARRLSRDIGRTRITPSGEILSSFMCSFRGFVLLMRTEGYFGFRITVGP